MTNRATALLHADTLAASLKLNLPHRRTDALRRIAEVLLGIVQAESPLHRKMALHLPRIASLESKTRVVARVFHDARLTPQDVLDVLLPLLPEGKLTLVMDRTTWHYGETPLNILVLGVALGGVVLPLTFLGRTAPVLVRAARLTTLDRMTTLARWTVLPHQGNSYIGARVLLVSPLLKMLPAKRWAVLIADREFIGEDWCSFLRWKGLRMCLRIREHTRLDDELARDPFTDLKSGAVRSLFESRGDASRDPLGGPGCMGAGCKWWSPCLPQETG